MAGHASSPAALLPPPQQREHKINDIVRGKHGISADTALRLSIVLGASLEFWMGLQSDYDLETASEAPGSRLRQEVTPLRQIAQRE